MQIEVGSLDSIKEKSTEILKSLYGKDAVFRKGQLEAIESTLTNHKTLVVQRTGWGKSLVYFICTKIIRENKKGVTFVVSPLLVLMENQIEAARKLNLKCDALNSTTVDRREEILDDLKKDKLDLIFITPETLFSDSVQMALKDISIGLFVVDEAHCISDWGHDFRLEYSNLIKIIKILPSHVHLLATTATANNRVVDDLKEQFGGDVYIYRGPLTRDSLYINIVNLENRADRYTWILKNINNLPGSGIIYCLTQRDCDYLTKFLNINNISAVSYYSKKNEEENEEAILKFQKNEIKVIVATIKLGMGFDKDDIGFVIHFQKPSNVVSYYQQIGRAGRNIEKAYAILLTGAEDDDINNYFISTAFPTKKECEKILEVLEKHNGSGINFILSKINMRKARAEKALLFLLNEEVIFKDNHKYYLTSNSFKYNNDLYEEITSVRKKELEEITNYTKTEKCLSKYIVNCLDDFTACECGKCSNCLKSTWGIKDFTLKDKEVALEYLKNLIIKIEPRKRWVKTEFTEATAIPFINEEGFCLSKYGDVGYGQLVKEGKYINNTFCDELVGKSAEILEKIVKENGIKHLTNIPSLRSDIVEDFAKRLAERLKIKYINLLDKKSALPQKVMENSSFQCENAQRSFSVKGNVFLPEKVLLIDDAIDSKWTITVCGYKLMEKGVKKVFPFALADTSHKEI